MKEKLVFLSFAVFLLFGCLQGQNGSGEIGFLEGTITIGPICPVERYPADPNCNPTAETYKAWPIVVKKAGTNEFVAKLDPALDGNYKVGLAPGDYIVENENASISPFGIGTNNLPANITIQPNKSTTLDIDIDTGIR